MRNCSGKAMNSEPGHELTYFVSRFLETHGAVVENQYHTLDVLLPEHLAEQLATPEHIRICPGSNPETTDTYGLQYGSPLLEKMVNAACATVPVIFCELSFEYLKSQGFDRLIQERFTFPNSVGRVMSQARVFTDYLFVTCWYLAQSDEQKMGLLRLIFNLETGASVPEMAEILGQVSKEYKIAGTPRHWTDEQMKRVIPWIEKQTKTILSEELDPFLASMTRRFRRDLANMEEYYASLAREMEQGLERAGLSEQLVSDRKAKIAQLPAELERKKDDLQKKYSVRIRLEPATIMVVRTPAMKIFYRASIGKQHRDISLMYNPVTKTFDPLLCQGCKGNMIRITFCDRLQALCPACRKKY